jgi:biopolymer transport protein ExbB
MRSVRFRRVLFAALAGLALAPGVAHAWWNAEWTGRKQIRIDTSAAGGNVTDPIGPAAVLVRLHAGNFKFEAAKPDGSDLRVVAGDDATPLKHHVEKWDGLLGEALLWVGLPDLKPGAATTIWLYYGNAKAAPADDAKGTFDAATTLAYHFAEHGQPPKDSTTFGNHAATPGASVDGALIGAGLRLDGAATISIPASPALAWPAGTWSAWVKPAEAGSSGVVFGRGALEIGLDAGRPFVDAGGGQRIVAPTPIDCSWHHLAVTAGRELALYVDGVLVEKASGSLPVLDGPSTLGGPADAAPAPARKGGKARPPGFKGDLDELQIAKVERPAGWVKLAAISQGADPGKLVVFGQDEAAGSSGGTGYFSILIGAVTLDGWVVIGLLAVMAVVSWMVMVSKASYLSAVEKANVRFDEKFRHLSADLVGLVASSNGVTPLGDVRVLRASPLYRVFAIGAEEIRKRTHRGEHLTAEAIEAIRASLDAGVVRESQRLSQRMVLLTIAISGGPFLGLLGTVVGVMITFAAIAAAGDVNVNAIAPGIAAALVATVAGLGVAIPALFGYNWLLTRIKDVNATLQVFVDELVTKIAEAYAEHAPREPQPPRAASATATLAE